MRLGVRIGLFLTALAAAGAVLVVAAVIAAYFYLAPSLPDAQELREVRLQVPLSIYSRDGRLLGQWGEIRRTPVEYEQIPKDLVNAFLAAEDDRFFEHSGVDVQGLVRAGISLAASGEITQGGSTITMQLAKIFFLTPEQTFVRKARQIFLALKIERAFDKGEILDLYLNKIFLGQRAYGVQAAAEVYFGKDLDGLTLAEMATIAGLPKAPSRDNPVTNPTRAEARRAYVLRRMLEVGFIDQSAYQTAMLEPMISRRHGPQVELTADYVAEMVRSVMVRRLGPAAYTSGFKVTTTIDSRLQAAANKAVQDGLTAYDQRHGYRGPVGRLDQAAVEPPADAEPGRYWEQLLADYPDVAGLKTGLVLAVGEQTAEVFIRRLGRYVIPWEGLAWARAYLDENQVGEAPERAADVLALGDLVQLAENPDGSWRLAQLPQVQGAFVALDPMDGAVAALVGGYAYYVSKYNRATQAQRQPGSAFKPFVYSAALENGFTAATVVNDAPVVLRSAELEDVWRPKNYSGRFNGPTRLREALVKSLNLVSVRVIRETGIGATVQHLRGFGFSAPALPRNPSLALGAGGTPPIDLAAGYAVFANGGFRVEPYFIQRIEDSTGAVLFSANPAMVCIECPVPEAPAEQPSGPVAPDADELDELLDEELGEELVSDQLELYPPLPQAERVLTPQNAYLISDMMRDVVRRGTGRRAYTELQREDLAGKTGTSNDRRDAWFSGFNGDLVATAWVGFDEDRSLGNGEEGGRTALPLWNSFMAQALQGVPSHVLERPAGLVDVRIDRDTGLAVGATARNSIFEKFRVDHVPPEQAPVESSEPRLDGDVEEPVEEERLF
jgi:penicillin-binding protein 1A